MHVSSLTAKGKLRRRRAEIVGTPTCQKNCRLLPLPRKCRAEDDGQFRRKAKPSIVLHEGGRDRRERQRADAERVENSRCDGRPLWTPVGERTRGMKTCEPTIPSLGFARTESDSRHAPGTATPMPSTFMANMSVHSTIRCDSHTTRRVTRTCVFTHSPRRSRSIRCVGYAVAAFSFSMVPPRLTMPNGGFG